MCKFQVLDNILVNWSFGGGLNRFTQRSIRECYKTRHASNPDSPDWRPEVLTLRDLPTPEPGAGEALIRIAASGVNFIDTLLP